jgi:hypothetical protein
MKLMNTILCCLMLSACGDGARIDTFPQQFPTNPTAPLCDLGTVARCYDACLARNPNYYGSPAWFYWIEQCKKRWGVYSQTLPYPNRPYQVGGDV